MLYLEQVLKYNFCFQESRMISVDKCFLFSLISKATSFNDPINSPLLPHHTFGNLLDHIWHQKDMLLASWHVAETNQFLLPARVMKVLLCSAFCCHGNRRWDFPMGLDLYIYTEKSSSLKAWSLFCCHVHNTINAINWVPRKNRMILIPFMWV